MELQNLSNEIHLAKKAAKESGDILINNKSEYNLRLNSNSKDTKLKADIESESLIKNIISEDSSFPILAEESGKSNDDLGDTFWVIDPLDGTKEFIKKNGEFTVNIALIQKTRPVLGIVELPVSFTQYYSDGYKSYKKVKNSKKIITSEKLTDFVITISRSHKDDKTDELEILWNGILQQEMRF